MPGRGKKRTNSIYTLAGTIVSALAALAASETKAIVVPLAIVAAILFVFTLVLWYQVRQDSREHENGSHHRAPLGLHPEQLAKELDPTQRDYIETALRGAVTDVANVVGVSAAIVRANLFARNPDTDKLRMVKSLWHNMSKSKERTIQMEIGRGSTGIAWSTRDPNKAVWKDGWGASDVSNAKELQKVDPELRWILSVPIFGSKGPETRLVLNVDGLSSTPTDAQLSTALTHLPRFGQGISRVLGL